MKKLNLLIALVCVMCSCHKHKEQPVQEATIIGQWEWVKTPGSWGGPETPQSTGKSWTITFKSDSSFLRSGDYMIQAMPDQTGTFNLNTGNLINGLGNGLYVTLRSPNMNPWVFRSFLSGNSLILDSGSPFDAPSFYFVKR